MQSERGNAYGLRNNAGVYYLKLFDGRFLK